MTEAVCLKGARHENIQMRLLSLHPQFCPDCGKEAVRNATEAEVRVFHRDQRILAEELRMGLYATTG